MVTIMCCWQGVYTLIASKFLILQEDLEHTFFQSFLTVPVFLF